MYEFTKFGMFFGISLAFATAISGAIAGTLLCMKLDQNILYISKLFDHFIYGKVIFVLCLVLAYIPAMGILKLLVCIIKKTPLDHLIATRIS